MKAGLKRLVIFLVVTILMSTLFGGCFKPNNELQNQYKSTIGDKNEFKQPMENKTTFDVNMQQNNEKTENNKSNESNDKLAANNTSLNKSNNISENTVKQRKVSIPILYYHAIDDNIEGIEELFVSPKEFEKQMEFLKKNNYTVITFDQIEYAANFEKPVIITFDDGYENNYKYAYPILKKYNFRATIFLVTDFIDKPGILKTEQIKDMLDLINFQGHTLSHPDLTKLSPDNVERELSQSKKIIEDITGSKVDVLAYPTGYYNQNIINIAKKYYKYAVLNGGGLYSEGDSNYEIKRVYIPRNLDIQGFERKISSVGK